MAKSRKIYLGGKQLHELPIEHIVAFASRKGHDRYDLGIEGDHWRNRAIVAAFGDSDRATTVELVDNFHAYEDKRYSRDFDALRIGEHLGWAIEHGIVVGVWGGWHLVHREIQFELVGPERKQHAVRVRNVDGPEGVLAAKAWANELKRRERARVAAVKKHRPSILRSLDVICRLDPDRSVRDHGILEHFITGEFETVGALRGMIEDQLDSMDRYRVHSLEHRLAILCMIVQQQCPEPPKPPRVSSADDAVLEGLYL